VADQATTLVWQRIGGNRYRVTVAPLWKTCPVCNGEGRYVLIPPYFPMRKLGIVRLPSVWCEDCDGRGVQRVTATRTPEPAAR
jgi:hypothetical protein